MVVFMSAPPTYLEIRNWGVHYSPAPYLPMYLSYGRVLTQGLLYKQLAKSKKSQMQRLIDKTPKFHILEK